MSCRIEDFGSSQLFVVQPQQVRQKTDDVPAGREPADQAQIRFLEARIEEVLQRTQKAASPNSSKAVRRRATPIS